MTSILILPRELVLRILSLLPTSDLVSAGETCSQWRHLSRTVLATRLQARIITRTSWAALADNSHKLSDEELDLAADLVTTGLELQMNIRKDFTEKAPTRH